MEADSFVAVPVEKAPLSPFYKQKRFWIVLVVILVIVTVVVVPILLLVLFPKIAQDAINGSNIRINTVNITNPTPNSFTLAVEGTLTNAGPIGATVNFDPLTVGWKTDDGDVVELGNVTMSPVSVLGGTGTLSSTTEFFISNSAAFSNFTEYMLRSPSFIWNLYGTATVSALGRSISNLSVNKDVPLNGFNGFPGVSILQFALPGDNPQGGISMDILSNIPNESPIAVQLGTIVFNVSYQGAQIGSVQAENVFLQPTLSNTLSLKGSLIPQPNETLPIISQLMSAYIRGETVNTTVTGFSVAPDGSNVNPWLTNGVRNVGLSVPLNNGAQAKTAVAADSTVPVPTSPTPLNLISSIDMGSLNLEFTSQAPYAPTISSDNVQAGFMDPFGFTLQITEVQQNMVIANDEGVQIAQVTSSQFGNATSNQTAGILNFMINQSPLAVIPGQELAFQVFSANLTLDASYSFHVVGNATVGADTPIGHVTLSGIPFGAPVNISGLQGLTNPPPSVQSLDVVGGTQEGLALVITVAMDNPSILQISSGDVHFHLEYENQTFGDTTIQNFTFYRGQQTVNASSIFASAQGVGQDILTSFVAGSSSDVAIVGFNGTTDIAALELALPQLLMATTIPGLDKKLIVSSSVSILPSTQAFAAVTLNNPFTAGFKVTQVTATVSNEVGPIGNIDVQLGNEPIAIGGRSKGTSGNLPFTMNLQPAFVATLLRTQAIKNGLDVAPLDALLKLGNLEVLSKRTLEKRDIFDGFNISKFVLDALKGFTVTVDLASTIEIGDYSTPLKYHQDDVPALTDSSLLNLIPVVGQPIVQGIVDKSTISFSTILISDPTNSGFNAHIVGKVSDTGPIDAEISFPDAIELYWSGQKLGSIAMGAIKAKANVGADIDMDAKFTIEDASSLEAFSEVLLLQSSFEWQMNGSASVAALGYTFNNIVLNKPVSLNGFDGFAPIGEEQSALTIVPGSFSLFDPPGEQTIGIKAVTNLQSRSNIGLQATVGFENYFQETGTDLGPLIGANITIIPNPAGSNSTTSSLPFEGRLLPQNSTQGGETLAKLFNDYLSGNTTTLFVKGVSVSGPDGKVDWLSQAISKLQINNLLLPGLDKSFKLIQSVSLDNAEFDFVGGSAYAPIISSTSITSAFQLPFQFTMAIVQIKQNLVISADIPMAGRVSIANLDVGFVNATTSPTGPTTGAVHFAISKDLKIPLAVIDGAEKYFNLFTLGLTALPSSSFYVNGTVDAVAQTKIGSFPVNALPVNVKTNMTGLNNLGGLATVKSISVDGGTPSGIIINLVASITNPSTVTIDVGNVSFDTFLQVFALTGDVGQTTMKNLVLIPGTNDYNVTFIFNPAQDKASQQVGALLLSGFLQGQSATLNIKGSTNSTSIPSLQTAFASVKLNASITGIPPTLIKQTDLYTNIPGLMFSSGNSTVTLQNPFNAPITLVSTNVANITYHASDYPKCPEAKLVGDWGATSFGIHSSYNNTPGPSDVHIPGKSNATSPIFNIHFEIANFTDTRPVVYGLICPALLGINGTVINNQGVASAVLSANVQVGTYPGVITYSQQVSVFNHFDTPTAMFGVPKTVYCLEAGKTCCVCLLQGTGCPAPGVCPPFNGTSVPPPTHSSSSSPTVKRDSPRTAIPLDFSRMP